MSLVDKVRHALPGDIGAAKGIGVAFSGGADSLALLLALCELSRTVEGFPQVVALHCNFRLRGDESDCDTAFCHDITRSYGLTIATKFLSNVRGIGAQTGESIEMVCRRLRYEWFAEYAREGYWIAVGHHVEDNRETMMLNMLRGTGLKGLTGMRGIDRERRIIRPLLEVTRREIEDYLAGKNQTWRTDSSNLSDEYQRNKLRLNVLPTIRLNFPDGLKGIDTSVSHLNVDYSLLEEYLDRIVRQVFNSSSRTVDLKLLRVSTGVPERILFEILKAYGFNYGQCENIMRIAEKEGYKIFEAKGARVEANHDRASIVFPIGNETPEAEVEAPSLEELSQKIEGLLFEEVTTTQPVEYVKREMGRAPNGKVLLLDADNFDDVNGGGTVAWRGIREGDRLKVFGMKGRSRLVSDILSDCHASPGMKRGARVLTESNGNILWLAGHRASEHHRITEKTRRIYKLTFNTEKFTSE